eukprot:jgi/Mesen1/4182/ME000219S03313
MGLKFPKLSDSSTSIADINGSYFRFESFDLGSPVAAAVDWRKTAASTVVKNQMQCGSCWAVAAADAVSMMWAISRGLGAKPAPPLTATGDIPSSVWGLDLSSQQICDCAGRGCCEGGYPEAALNYIMFNGGLASMATYPYFATNNTCNTAQAAAVQAQITGWEHTPARSLTAVRQALMMGPVVVLISAAAPDFQNYTGGVYNGNCTYDLDHAVVAVGYGTDPVDGPYLIIKNSWGSDWGENGYMRISATDGVSQCGLLSTPSMIPTYYPPTAINPCLNVYPPPCGAGTCYVEKSGKKVRARCACPAGFVENTGGIAKCVRADPCFQNPNPCGTGQCKNGADGSYSCVCPPGTTIGAAAAGSSTCVSGNGTSGVRTYTTIPDDTCDSIVLNFKITLSQFNLYNQGINCQNLLAGTVVAVGTDAVTQQGCGASYTVLAGDTCPRISAAQLVQQETLLSLNPTLDCLQVLPGQVLCVAPAAPVVQKAKPACGMTFDVQKELGYDTCQWMVTKFTLDWPTFYLLNPGIKCDDDLPGSLSVCVAPVGSVVAPRQKVNCTQTYRVQHGDTCPTIWNAAGLTSTQFFLVNPGVQCNFPYLQVGQQVCVAGPQLSTAFTNAVPYVVKAGDTLASISLAFTSRCGTYASPANICSQNLLLSCLLPLAVGQTLQVPCQWPVGRSCGCTPSTPYCGSDGDWYSSYCDVVCNYATPAHTSCNSCQAACNDRCGAGQRPYGGPDYCPNPCAYPPWPPVSWNWFSSSECSFYYQACSSCCAGGWGYGSGNYWNCVGYCRYGKC